MDRAAVTGPARELMQDFAKRTGLDPVSPRPVRYLWTDAFAVCNYLGFFNGTGNPSFRDLALRLVGQVHHTLGRYRDDAPHTGWISGLPAGEGEAHPAIGGLRIGKPLPERPSGEPYDEQQEWDRDGQYYHYLTKWMHALCLTGRVTGDPAFIRWAVELARTSHAGFTYRAQGSMRMYWKMSTDLSRPLVSSMGQHDPIDGLVTYAELDLAGRDFGLQSVLGQESTDMAGMVRGIPLATGDPLAVGGLLSDAVRITRLTARGASFPPDLLGSVISAALEGLESFADSRSLELPARFRLAFRELGLAIGLAGVDQIPVWIEENPGLFEDTLSLHKKAELIRDSLPVRDAIMAFWLDRDSQASITWTEHREINTVMLATGLVPGGFLEI